MTTDHHRTTLSPREAARVSGASRSTIMRALSSGQLEARRDNHNAWQIERDALDRWMVARDEPDRTMTGPPQMGHLLDLAAAREDLAAARTTVSQLQSRLDVAEQDRDRWRSMAERLADRSSVTQPPAPRRRWWPW